MNFHEFSVPSRTNKFGVILVTPNYKGFYAEQSDDDLAFTGFSEQFRRTTVLKRQWEQSIPPPGYEAAGARAEAGEAGELQLIEDSFVREGLLRARAGDEGPATMHIESARADVHGVDAPG